MTAKRAGAGKKKASSKAQTRVTVSFPPKVYETLDKIAKQNKVSFAWVVREAAERYIGEKWPLFKETE